MIDLRSLEAFLVVSDTRSFTGAAKRLNRTQSAISQTIRQLEDELGVVLIDRSGRALSLTAAGELLRNPARELFERAAGLSSLVREQGHVKLSELRFAMVDSFAVAVGPALIKSMLGESLNLSLWSEYTPRLGEALLDRRADVIVANDAFDEQDTLVRFELFREPYVLLLPKTAGWEAGNGDLARLARSRPLIGYQASSHMRVQIESQFHRSNIAVSRRVTVDSTEKLLAMVAAGIGWSSSTPLSLLRSRQHVEAITVLPFPGEHMYRRLFILARRGEMDELTRRLCSTARSVLAGPILAQIAQICPAAIPEIRVPTAEAPE
jgi:DNA-binding transcriptional LysR family regulator